MVMGFMNGGEGLVVGGGAPSMRTRLLGALIVLAMLGVGWWYVATHDVAGGFRRFQAGKAFDQRARVRPVAPHRTVPSPGHLAGEAWSTVRGPFLAVAVVLVLALAMVVALRL